MAITNAAVTVTTSATKIASADPTRRRLLLHNGSGGTIYIGGSGVTTANGHHIKTQEELILVQATDADATIKQEWYAIVGSGTGTLTVMEVSD
jgi:hypothetical protein